MQSLRSRLFLMLLLLIILPYFIIVLIIYHNSLSSIEQQELEEGRDTLAKSAEDLTKHFNRIIELPYALYNSPNILQVYEKGFTQNIDEQLTAFEKTMETFSVTQPELRQIRFYFHQGQTSLTLYNASISAPKEQTDLHQQPPFKELYESNDNYVLESPRALENYDNTAIIPGSDHTMVVPLHHKVINVLNGKFLGFLTIDLELSSFLPYIQHLISHPSDQVYLINDKDEIIYSNKADEIGQVQKVRNFSLDKAVLEKDLAAPLLDWKLVKIVSKEALVQEANQAVYINVLLGLGVVLMGVLMILIISRIITKPLSELSKQVQKIKSGGGEISVDSKYNDEIWYLSTQMQQMLQRIQTHINREYKLELELKKSEYRLLKSQVNPHFLFNALQTIGAVALRSNNLKVYKLIISLSGLMRYSLNADHFVKVREEYAYIQSYLHLQKERFGDDVKVEIEVEEGIMDLMIPSMIIQPLVENYFKHSFEAGYDAATLRIIGRRKEEFVEFHVSNDGAPVEEKKLQAMTGYIYGKSKADGPYKSGVGLKNIYDRLILHYGKEASMKFGSSNGKGFYIQITLPLTRKETLSERG
ncbi:sensor histidine kinase [Bacillus sp. P14.5]|uniref:cache domain-containing sensor histidine kinase n=1 Tax=Bacillus sp. P14.5 TaxID=1983400 RepID=UPI000DE80690|nr:sensor histidine kinase [Bacillus sp. P14.5]